ncbi:MAG: hypothetical protein ACI8S6_004864 [Myxococcota bacterium]
MRGMDHVRCWAAPSHSAGVPPASTENSRPSSSLHSPTMLCPPSVAPPPWGVVCSAWRGSATCQPLSSRCHRRMLPPSPPVKASPSGPAQIAVTRGVGGYGVCVVGSDDESSCGPVGLEGALAGAPAAEPQGAPAAREHLFAHHGDASMGALDVGGVAPDDEAPGHQAQPGRTDASPAAGERSGLLVSEADAVDVVFEHRPLSLAGGPGRREESASAGIEADA